MLSQMLEPLFEECYPNHPYFAETIGMTEVSTLINDFFSGARQSLAEVQQLAKTFALPLGLVAQHGNTVALETEEKLVKLPLAEEILSLVKTNGETPVSLKHHLRTIKTISKRISARGAAFNFDGTRRASADRICNFKRRQNQSAVFGFDDYLGRHRRHR